MKSTFAQTFATVAIIFLTALLLLGIAFQLLAKDLLTKRSVEGLKHDGQIIAQLVQAYSLDPGLSSQNYHIALTAATSASGADAIICNAQGHLLYCADKPYGCEHTGLVLESSYLQRCFSQNGSVDTGTISGLYSDNRYVVSVPIRKTNGTPMGLVIMSQPINTATELLSKISEIFVFVSLSVVGVLVVLLIYFARRQSTPLRQMAEAARSFGHGDFNARVPIDSHCSQEVSELALAFNNMATSLEKSEYGRQEFVANVSHELKTPMTTISGYVDGILDGTIPKENHRKYLSLVSSETKRLSRLVRNMLDVSRLQDQAGISPLQISRFDLTEQAGQVLISFEKQILDKNLDVQVNLPEHPVFTQACHDQVTQVLYNLLDNAIKFSPEQGVLGLEIQEGGNKAYIRISNQGATIPPEELPLVFERFHKLDKSRTENRDSWGLGLYIVKTIMDIHGENISVTSENGTTAFTFTLPLVL